MRIDYNKIVQYQIKNLTQFLKKKTTLGHLALIPTSLDVHICAVRVVSSRAVENSTINVYRTSRNTEQSRSFFQESESVKIVACPSEALNWF